MIRGIDHLVIACEDPDAAAEELASGLGIISTGGGRHEAFGTRNRIAWLADGSYLELIGIEDPERASTSPVGAAAIRALEGGGGLATWAALVDDVGAAAQELDAAGASWGLPAHGTRRRDDGELVEWWTAFPSRPLEPAVPFLIQHALTGAEWGSEAREERSHFMHALGSPVLLSRLDLAASDPPSSAASLHGLLGLDVWAVADLAVADIGPHVVRLVPRREMAVPAVVTLGADVDTPLTADLLGLRFDVERVALPVTSAPSA
ncbi:MAG TPA: VOC family protein [Candidatus Angelobacter sp.]|nr:VOC family protein [Candidatus Angelobacter sp.]